MILKRLKLATGASHVALEKQLPLMNADLSRDEYRRCLARFYGFYAPLEDQLLTSPHWSGLALDYASRLKTPRLVRDLVALGSSAAALAELPRCMDLPNTYTPEHLLGSLYVIEGATLGGRIITRHLQVQLGLTPESGGAFFDGYGAQTGDQWKAFCALLSHHATPTVEPSAVTESRHEAIAAGANQTFDTLTRWLLLVCAPTTVQHDLQGA
jgi:heme oxygenase